MLLPEPWGGGDRPEHDEQEFTAHAEPGWLAWDAWSPEVEFCQFVGVMQRMLDPAIILETGVGVGRITRYLDLEQVLGFLMFESNPDWQRNETLYYQPDPSPSPQHMGQADLVILDSDLAFRFAEIEMWGASGKPGSTCIIHDAGNGHRPPQVHVEIRAAIEKLGIPGAFLANPRGGWMGVHP